MAAAAAEGPVEPRHIMQAVVRTEDGIAADLMRARAQKTQEELVAVVDRLVTAADSGRTALFESAPTTGVTMRCSFCGKDQTEVRKLIAGPSVFICDECVGLCDKILANEQQSDRSKLAARVDLLAEQLAQLRNDLDATETDT
jgi:hypothetical protein